MLQSLFLKNVNDIDDSTSSLAALVVAGADSSLVEHEAECDATDGDNNVHYFDDIIDDDDVVADTTTANVSRIQTKRWLEHRTKTKFCFL